MTLIILGIVVLIVGVVGAKPGTQIHRYKSLFMIAGILIIAIGALTSAIRQINVGQVGVQVLFGDVQETVLYEGLNVVNPLIDVREMTIQTQNYTMSSTVGEGGQVGDDAIRVLSKDGLEVIIDLTVLYRIIPTEAPNIFRNLGMDFQNKIVRSYTRSRIREAAVNYDAIDLYSTKREEFENQIRISIEKDFKDRGIMLEQLLVRKINLPESVKQSIERKITAVQEAQRMKYVLEKEEQEAQRKRVEARGKADAQDIVDKSLTGNILRYELIQVQKELVNSQNSKIIILGDSKGTPPFIIGK